MVTDNILPPDRDIKRFLVATDDGRVELNLTYVGMMDYYCVTGRMQGVPFTYVADTASQAYDLYNRYFIDAKTEAAALLVKATGAHV